MAQTSSVTSFDLPSEIFSTAALDIPASQQTAILSPLVITLIVVIAIVATILVGLILLFLCLKFSIIQIKWRFSRSRVENKDSTSSNVTVTATSDATRSQHEQREMSQLPLARVFNNHQVEALILASLSEEERLLVNAMSPSQYSTWVSRERLKLEVAERGLMRHHHHRGNRLSSGGYQNVNWSPLGLSAIRLNPSGIPSNSPGSPSLVPTARRDAVTVRMELIGSSLRTINERENVSLESVVVDQSREVATCREGVYIPEMSTTCTVETDGENEVFDFQQSNHTRNNSEVSGSRVFVRNAPLPTNGTWIIARDATRVTSPVSNQSVNTVLSLGRNDSHSNIPRAPLDPQVDSTFSIPITPKKDGSDE